MRVLVKLGAFALACAFVLVGALPLVLYWVGLSGIEGRPLPTARTQDLSADYAFLATRFKGRSPVAMTTLTPWSYSFRADSGGPIAWIIASRYNADHLKHRGMLWWHLSGAALTIWITQHWSQDQAVSAAATILRSGPASNNAFERTGSLSSRARVRRARHCAPATRLKARQPAAQRER
jgi:hypothetical protein